MKSTLVALLIYSIIALVLLGAVWSHPSTTTYPDVSRDNYANFWDFWWVQHAIRSGLNPFYTHELYFPTGTSLKVYEFGPLYGLFSIPIFLVGQSWQNAVFAHNLWIVATFILTAMAGFLFARAISGSEPGALVAGFTLGFCSFRFHHLEHLNLLSFYWIPLAALAGHRVALRNYRDEKAFPIASLVALVLCGLGAAGTSLTVLVLAVFFLAIWSVLIAFLDRRRYSWPKAILAVVVLGLGSLPVTGGPAFAYLRGTMGNLSASAPDLARYSPDLIGFVTPGQSAVLSPLWPHAFSLHGAGGRNMYLGFASLTLAVIGLKRAGRRGAPLGVTALIGLLAALGPGIWIAGTYHDLPISLTQILQHLPLFSINRVPERYVLVTLTALTPLVALGFESLARIKSRRAWAAGLVLLAAIELVPPPIRAVPVAMPDVYFRLRDDPHPGAMLELSLVGRKANEFVLHQIVHRRPMMMGPVNRPSAAAVDFLEKGMFKERLSDPVAFSSALQDLRQVGVAFLVWHREGWDTQDWEALCSMYATKTSVWFRSEDLIVFRLADS